MKKMIKQALILSFAFLSICGISTSAKTATTCAGTTTSYGTVSCISYQKNGWSHTTKYVFGGTNITKMRGKPTISIVGWIAPKYTITHKFVTLFLRNKYTKI